MRGDGSVNGFECWGIYRELAHSPGRETDDAEILRATARQLEERGFRVSLRTAEEIAASSEEPPPFLFVMCERLEILRRLESASERGVCQVNSASAIRNTYRDRMLPLFQHNRVPFPASVIVETSSPLPDGPAFPHGSEGCWIKRGDVHATQAGDVVFAPDPRTAARGLKELAGRGIANALIQAHVPGDLIKFYGVGDVGHRAPGDRSDGGAWFEWFYHRDQRLEKHPFNPADLAAAASRAAASLGLEVFGGDAIATRDGRVFVIDLNAWPSFALYRETASEKIASYLAARFRGHVAIGVTE
jgi:glutathione synthase/RimK-type ligase-like ATP-grasp enzyme